MSPAPVPVPRTVLDASDISRALTRIAHEILERNRGADPVVLLGIPTRGVGLAARISERIAAVEDRSVPTGSLDVTMYRDDIGLKPARALEHTDLPPGGIDGKVVVLVDDVLFSGRTIRAALEAIGDIGRPKAVQLAVRIDRAALDVIVGIGRPEATLLPVLCDRCRPVLPLRADYVRKNLPTSLLERVTAHLSEYDDADAVIIADKLLLYITLCKSVDAT